MAVWAICASFAAAKEAELALLIREDFEQGMERWETSDPDKSNGVWRIEAQHGDDASRAARSPAGATASSGDGASRATNHVLRVTGPSKYQPPFRSPHSIALMKDLVVGDFELTARVQNTNVNAGPHRDLCLFWGYQDPAHFYYVHFGANADPHACQIFIVDGAARRKITVDEAEGTPWSDGWHDVKVIRNVADGTMEVYFDDMTRPMMTARDKSFTWGQVGLGTFDDHGNFDDVELRGERVSDLDSQNSD